MPGSSTCPALEAGRATRAARSASVPPSTSATARRRRPRPPAPPSAASTRRRRPRAWRGRGRPGAVGPRWPASSRSGRRLSASTSSAARPAVNAASACGTVAGSIARARAVESSAAGTATTQARAGCGSIRTARAPPDPVQPDRDAAEQRGRGVVGVALEVGGDLQRRGVVEQLGPLQQAARRDDAGDHRGGRRPDPASVRDPVAAHHDAGPAAGAPTRASAARTDRTTRFCSPVRDPVGPLALDPHLRRPARSRAATRTTSCTDSASPTQS